MWKRDFVSLPYHSSDRNSETSYNRFTTRSPQIKRHFRDPFFLPFVYLIPTPLCFSPFSRAVVVSVAAFLRALIFFTAHIPRNIASPGESFGKRRSDSLYSAFLPLNARIQNFTVPLPSRSFSCGHAVVPGLRRAFQQLFLTKQNDDEDSVFNSCFIPYSEGY